MTTITCQDPVYTHDDNYNMIVLIVCLLLMLNLLTFAGLFMKN